MLELNLYLGRKCNMKETFLFSVIFPVYNVDKYLDAAMAAMEAQTYHNYEVILVDDCATDNSGSICDTYAKRHDNFTCIHFEENQGVSAARNAGIERARGDYILFLDPDDLFEATLLETVATSLNEHPVDVLVYSLTEDYYNGAGRLEYSKEHSMPTMTITDQKTIHQMVVELEKETMYGYPWNKAYSASYLYESGAAFQRIPHIEDILFNISFFQDVNSMTILEDKLYHYRNQGQARLTGRYFPEYFAMQKQRIETFIAQQESWGNCDEEVMDTMAAVYFRSFLSYIQRELDHGVSKKDVIAMAEKEMQEDLYLQVQDFVPTEGKVARLIYEPMAEGKIKPAIWSAQMISFVRRFFPILYAKLKQNR